MSTANPNNSFALGGLRQRPVGAERPARAADPEAVALRRIWAGSTDLGLLGRLGGVRLQSTDPWPYTGRTCGGGVMSTRLRSERLEVRTTKDERALIDRAAAEQGSDLTEFVISNLTVAARRVLADRTEFQLDVDSAAAWDSINRRRARDLPGLRQLMERPSAFVDE